MSSSDDAPGLLDTATSMIDDESVWLSVDAAPSSSSTSKSSSSALSTSSSLLGRQLQELEHQLRCRICRELFRIPTTLLPCGHHFCHECVLTFLKEKRSLRSSKNKDACSCPICRTVVLDDRNDFEKSLHPNRVLQGIVTSFANLRGNLVTALLSKKETAASAAPAVKQSNDRWVDEEDDDDDYDHDDDDYQEHGFAAAKGVIAGNGVVKEPMVTQRIILPTRLAMKKTKELQALCKQHHLDCSGRSTDAELRDRLKRYALLWNSYCSSSSKEAIISVRELRRIFAQRELQQQQAARLERVHGTADDSVLVDKLFQQRNNDTDNNNNNNNSNSSNAKKSSSSSLSLSSGSAKFDAKWNAGFAHLIQQGKRHQPQRGRSKKEEEEEEDNDEFKDEYDREQDELLRKICIGGSIEVTASKKDSDNQEEDTTSNADERQPFKKMDSNNNSNRKTPHSPNQEREQAFKNDTAQKQPAHPEAHFEKEEESSAAAAVVNQEDSSPQVILIDVDASPVTAAAPSISTAATTANKMEVTASSSNEKTLSSSRLDSPLKKRKNSSGTTATATSDCGGGVLSGTTTTLANCDDSCTCAGKCAHKIDINNTNAAAAVLATADATSRRYNYCKQQSDNNTTTSFSSSNKKRRTSMLVVGPWTCPRCTLINARHTSSRASCEACGLQRGSREFLDLVAVE